MKRLLYFIPLVIVLAGLVVFGLQLRDISEGKNVEALESAMIGKTIPDFSLPDLENPDITRLQGQLPNEPFLINVWATWCPTCKAEHPYLMKLAREKGIKIIGLDYKDERNLALDWLKNLGNPYSYTLFDKEGALGFELGVYGAPETFVIGPDKTILHRHVGMVDEAAWNTVIEPLLKGEKTIAK